MRSPCRGSSWGTALPAQFVHVLPSTEGCVWPALFSWGCAKWGYSSLMSPLVSHRTNSRTFSGCSLCYNEGRTKSREVSERKHDSKELHCLLSKWNGACRFVIYIHLPQQGQSCPQQQIPCFCAHHRVLRNLCGCLCPHAAFLSA